MKLLQRYFKGTTAKGKPPIYYPFVTIKVNSETFKRKKNERYTNLISISISKFCFKKNKNLL